MAEPGDEDGRGAGGAWPLDERPGYLARRLHQIHVGLFAGICGDQGLTPLQFSLLSTLSDLGEADQTTLARAIALDRTTTTGALKRLEARGFVARAACGRDRRARSCRLSGAGAALLREMTPAVLEAHRATLDGLEEGERATFLRLLAKLVAAHDARGGD